MKKTLFLLVILSTVLGVSSCKRSELNDPDWDGPAGFYVLLEGSASPAVLFIDGNMHTSRISVRVTDSKGNPLPGRTIFFEQLADSLSHQQLDWGYFDNGLSTISKVSNASGEVSATFYGPVEFYSGAMIIHALMQVDGRAYRGSDSHVGTVPQDYIAITMYNSGSAGAGTTK
jgi:hypothetical protein